MTTIQCPPIPADTRRAAASVFGRDHPYVRLGEILESLWEQLDPGGLVSADSFLVHSFHPYSLATILQYWEELSDRQMSQATRSRLDLKYALHLPLNFPGFEPPRLCTFRQHLFAAADGRAALQHMIDWLGSFPCAQKGPVEAERLLSAVCLPSRAEIVVERIEMALESVAASDPSWLRRNLLPHWYRRYEQWPQGYRKAPRGTGEIQAEILSAGRDGWHLLQAIENTDAATLASLPEVENLRGEWRRQFEEGAQGISLRPRCCPECSDCSNFLQSGETGKEADIEAHEHSMAGQTRRYP